MKSKAILKSSKDIKVNLSVSRLRLSLSNSKFTMGEAQRKR